MSPHISVLSSNFIQIKELCDMEWRHSLSDWIYISGWPTIHIVFPFTSLFILIKSFHFSVIISYVRSENSNAQMRMSLAMVLLCQWQIATPRHCGSERPVVPAMNPSIFHELRNEWVSEGAHKWVQRSAAERTSKASRVGQANEWVFRADEQMSKWPTTYTAIFGCSEP